MPQAAACATTCRCWRSPWTTSAPRRRARNPPCFRQGAAGARRRRRGAPRRPGQEDHIEHRRSPPRSSPTSGPRLLGGPTASSMDRLEGMKVETRTATRSARSRTATPTRRDMPALPGREDRLVPAQAPHDPDRRQRPDGGRSPGRVPYDKDHLREGRPSSATRTSPAATRRGSTATTAGPATGTRCALERRRRPSPEIARPEVADMIDRGEDPGRSPSALERLSADPDWWLPRRK